MRQELRQHGIPSHLLEPVIGKDWSISLSLYISTCFPGRKETPRLSAVLAKRGCWQFKTGTCQRNGCVWGVLLCSLATQEGTVVAAEGIDKFGKGVLRMSFMPLSETGTIRVNSQADAASTSLRIPVDALEMTGFGRSNNDKVGLLLTMDMGRAHTDNKHRINGKAQGARLPPHFRKVSKLTAPGQLEGLNKQLMESFVPKNVVHCSSLCYIALKISVHKLVATFWTSSPLPSTKIPTFNP